MHFILFANVNKEKRWASKREPHKYSIRLKQPSYVTVKIICQMSLAQK